MQGDAPIKYITFKVQTEFFDLILQINVFRVKKYLLLKMVQGDFFCEDHSKIMTDNVTEKFSWDSL